MRGCDYICVSSFLAWRKLTAGSCGVFKASLCVMHMFFLFVPVFMIWGEYASHNVSVTLSLPFCMFVCMCVCVWLRERAGLSCMPVILCMPLCAPQSFTWHQSESSGIVISLPTACCWLKPAVCTLRLHPLFSSPSPPLSPASLSFARLASPPLLYPSTPESHHSAVSPLLSAKEGPISSSAESLKLPSFFLFSFSPLFLCSFFFAVH